MKLAMAIALLTVSISGLKMRSQDSDHKELGEIQVHEHQQDSLHKSLRKKQGHQARLKRSTLDD